MARILPSSRLRRASFIACLALACCASDAWTQTTNLGQLPNKRRVAGFTLLTSIESIGGNGYQPMHLSFRPTGKTFLRDRNVSVVITPRRSYGSGLDFSLRQATVLPQGSLGEELDIYIPYYFTWDNVDVQLLEDGRPIESGRESYPLLDRNKFMGQHVSIGLIFGDGKSAVSEKCPDVRTLNTVFGEGPMPSDHAVKRLKHARAVTFAQQTQPAWVQYRLMDNRLNYDSWLGYSQLDVIVVAAPVLRRIRAKQPKQFAALEKWLAVGGNLWIYAADDQTDFFDGKLKSLSVSDNKFLRQTNQANSSLPSMHRLQLNEINDDSPISTDYWSEPQKQSQSMGQSGFMMRRDIFKELKSSKHPFADSVAWTKIKDKLSVHSLGLGQVILIQDEDPFPGSFQLWESVALISGSRLKWANRFGVDVAKGNDRFWSWLIPSVGTPPVKSFVFLNILFAAIVGPLCYFFLRRRDRLYLLYFAAPALAFLVTASLFAYAIGSDGLSTKIRSRQITWLDQAGELGIRQSRHTYYAVIGQSGGIQFAPETIVCPVSYLPIMNYNYRNRADREGNIAIDDDAQIMTGDFLPPRDQVQYITTTPFQTDQKIAFQFSQPGTSQPEKSQSGKPQSEKSQSGKPQHGQTVKNGSQYAIKRIIARDSNGSYWEATDLQKGASSTLSPSDKAGLQDLLEQDLLPSPSQFFVPELQHSNYYGRNKRAGIQTNTLEQRLQQWCRGSMPKNSFVATAELDHAVLGVSDAKVLDSVHLIMGDLP